MASEVSGACRSRQVSKKDSYMLYECMYGRAPACVRVKVF